MRSESVERKRRLYFYTRPYIVFSDAALKQMARDKPLTDDKLLHINGVGRHELARYGAAFLDTIARRAVESTPICSRCADSMSTLMCHNR